MTMLSVKDCLRPLLQRALLLGTALLIGVFSPLTNADAGTSNITKITLLPSQTTLSYSDAVRFSQVLSDAYAQLNYDVYALGTTLIDPNKQSVVDTQKHTILRQLQQLNTPEAVNLAKQLNALRFAFHEPMVTDPVKVRVQTKLNPMVRGEYWLSLPKRPNDISVFHPARGNYLSLPVNSGDHLKDYLTKLSDTIKWDGDFDSAWIIQADRKVYQVKDIQWKSTLYFLSPGAMVFIGLQNLPDEYCDLNADIAHMLAFRLEL